MKINPKSATGISRHTAVLLAVLALTAVAALIGGVRSMAGESAPAPSPGWHWEYYEKVRVQVPDGWQDTEYTHLWACPSTPKPSTPLVGRPSDDPVPAIYCGPVAPLANRVSNLWFGPDGPPSVTRHDHGWLTEIRALGGSTVSVFTDDETLRRQILDSAQLR
jgi:hypothetical protein